MEWRRRAVSRVGSAPSSRGVNVDQRRRALAHTRTALILASGSREGEGGLLVALVSVSWIHTVASRIGAYLGDVTRRALSNQQGVLREATVSACLARQAAEEGAVAPAVALALCLALYSSLYLALP